MKRIWYDFEFIEDGFTIDPISIGMVDDTDRTLHLFNRDCDLSKRNQWVIDNVWIPEDDSPLWRPKHILADEILSFIGDKPVELWADYCAYDHVCLMQFWGRMIDKPHQLPFYTNDVRALADWLVIDWESLPEPEDEHNALSDARASKARWHTMMQMLEV